MNIAHQQTLKSQQFKHIRTVLVSIVALAMVAQLAWEYTHGGVISHHLLNQKDLPVVISAVLAAISAAVHFLARYIKRMLRARLKRV